SRTASSGNGMEALNQENRDFIKLLFVSQREDRLIDLPKAPAISLFNECLNRLELLPEKLKKLCPDLLLVDTACSGSALIEWLRAIRNEDEAIEIILRCEHEPPDLIRAIVDFRISGIIQADTGLEMYEKAIQAVLKGELWFPHTVVSRVFEFFARRLKFQETESPAPPAHRFGPSHPYLKLTAREISIMELVARGGTNKQVAKELKISPETVKKHLERIFEKSGLRSRSQLAWVFGLSVTNDRR
ncbi:MAG: response regulator transcription factor, partial [Methylococcales bacterium]